MVMKVGSTPVEVAVLKCSINSSDKGAARAHRRQTHDRHARGHARPVGKPFDQRRHRRNVAEPESTSAEDAGNQIDEPELMDVDPMAETKNPPPKHSAAVTSPCAVQRAPSSGRRWRQTVPETRWRWRIPIRPGPASSRRGPNRLMPSSRVSGRLKVENAYAWPMDKCTASAAGGRDIDCSQPAQRMRARSRKERVTGYSSFAPAGT